jgi:octaprenyl-diphosphate synthase
MSQLTMAPHPTELLRGELAQVEEALLSASTSEIEAVQEAARHILGAGGKRVRPQMVLLTAGAFGGSLRRAVPVAAACELVHTATLVHDDIVDDSDSRRGRMAVQFYFGNSASVLMGDYLVVRAFRLVSGDPNREFLNELIDAIARMCEGEVLQICVKSDTSVRVEVYEKIIECKTALLMSACTRFGAILGGASPHAVEEMAEFGYNTGMAFQIQDDILDFVGEEKWLGKPVGTDLREGKVTLPVIFALQDARASERDALLGIYEKPGPLSAEEVRRAREIIAAAGGFDRARSHAMEYILRSRRNLAAMPDGRYKEALEALSAQIVDRSR